MDDLPLLDLFFSMLWFFLFIAWISCLFTILRDIFRSQDLSGWAKAAWALLIMVMPVIGVLIYLGIRGAGMPERDFQQYLRADQALTNQVRSAQGETARPSNADELVKLAQLRDRGVLTPTEFETQKASLLG